MKPNFRLSIPNMNRSDRPTKKMYIFLYLSLELKCPGFTVFMSLYKVCICVFFLAISPNGTQSSVINSYESKGTLRRKYGETKGV